MNTLGLFERSGSLWAMLSDEEFGGGRTGPFLI